MLPRSVKELRALELYVVLQPRNDANLYRKTAKSCRLTALFGENVVGEVPRVIPQLFAQATASRYEAESGTSVYGSKE